MIMTILNKTERQLQILCVCKVIESLYVLWNKKEAL